LKIYIQGLVIAGVIIAGLFYFYRSNENKLPVNQAPNLFKLIDEMEKQGMPDFELERLDGTKLKLSDYKGKVVVVNFWASWCNPCVEEFPSMVKLGKETQENVQIIAIATDDERKDIETFAKLFNLPQKGFEIVWDKDKSIMKRYGVEKIPESFLVNRDMKLIRKVLGVENWASPQALTYFKELVARPVGAAAPAAPAAGAHAGGGK
jgi:thiol-disulfide isomerase/thioredoxin